jgi:acetylornithine deacetylase/succinyl-diaminopimelate desuccinylase-like protein
MANTCVSTQTGDNALAGEDEFDITCRFPPDDTNDRAIWFKGYYIEIVKEETGEHKIHEVNKTPTTQQVKYDVPARYTCYVRGATVKLDR